MPSAQKNSVDDLLKEATIETQKILYFTDRKKAEEFLKKSQKQKKYS